MTHRENEIFRQLFPQKQIPVILSCVYQAALTLQKRAENEREDRLTGRLHKGLIRIHPFRDGPLSIHLKSKIPSSDADSDTAGGEIDLLVSCDRGYQVYFALEAKRLRFLSSSRRISGSDEYVKNGMMRFVSGKYAPFVEAGAMIGYVFDGKKDEARTDVDRHVRRKANELRLRRPRRLKPSTILRQPRVDETTHNLENRSFTLYHLFLAV